MEKSNFTKNVKIHKACLNRGIIKFITHLQTRAHIHDDDKLCEPQISLLQSNDSSEFKQGIDLHYHNNRHHPEKFKSGIQSMNLVDITEMLCDWNCYSSNNHKYSILDIIESKCNQYSISEDLKQVLMNTARYLGFVPDGEF